MRVDNLSTVTLGNNRDSIRIASKDSFEIGSLWITDMLHVPYGVSCTDLDCRAPVAHCGLVFRMALLLVFSLELACRRRGSYMSIDLLYARADPRLCRSTLSRVSTR